MCNSVPLASNTRAVWIRTRRESVIWEENHHPVFSYITVITGYNIVSTFFQLFSAITITTMATVSGTTSLVELTAWRRVGILLETVPPSSALWKVQWNNLGIEWDSNDIKHIGQLVWTLQKKRGNKCSSQIWSHMTPICIYNIQIQPKRIISVHLNHVKYQYYLISCLCMLNQKYSVTSSNHQLLTTHSTSSWKIWPKIWCRVKFESHHLEKFGWHRGRLMDRFRYI